MTGYESKKAMAQDKLNDDDALTIAYQSGYYDGKKAAQPEQEPVAYTLNCVCGAVWDIKADGSEEMAHTPDTAPPQRKPLTQDGTMEIANQTAGQYWMDEAHIQRFRAAVEAAHGIKENT